MQFNRSRLSSSYTTIIHSIGAIVRALLALADSDLLEYAKPKAVSLL